MWSNLTVVAGRSGRLGAYVAVLMVLLARAPLAAGQGAPDIDWLAAGHGHRISTVAYSPDGELIASANGDSTVKIWRTSDRRLLRTLVGHYRVVSALAFSPDGQRLASGAEGACCKEVKVWRVSDGQALWEQTLASPWFYINAVAFSADGQYLAVAGNDQNQLRNIRIHEAGSGAVVQELSGHTSHVRSVAFSPDGQWMASGGADFTLRLWRVGTWALMGTLTVGDLYSVTFSPDSALIATGDSASSKIWRVSNGQLLQTLSGQAGVNSVRFLPDGQTLATGASDRTIRLWQVDDGQLIRAINTAPDDVWSLGVSPDGQTLLSGASSTQGMSVSGRISLWRVSDGQLLGRLTEQLRDVLAAAFSPDGQMLAYTVADGQGIRVRRASDGQLLAQVAPGGGSAIAFSPDGQRMAAGNRVWRTADWSLEWTLATGGQGLAFSPDGQRLASGNGVLVEVWDLTTGQMLWAGTATTTASVRAVAFSPDGQMLASGAHIGWLRLWDAATGAMLGSWGAHGKDVWSLAFAPDGQTLWSGGGEGETHASGGRIRRWSVPDGAMLTEWTEDADWVKAIALTPDGQTLLSGSDGIQYAASILTGPPRLRLWDTQTGQVLRTYDRELGTSITSVAFSPDAQRFTYGRRDGTLVVARNPLPPCLADWNGDGVVDFNDFLAYLNDFNAGNPRADLNADGVVDFNDFLEFLNLYNVGC